MSLEKRMAKDGLTRSTLFHFLCGCREDIQNLNCYFHHFFRHRQSQRDLGISLEAPKEILNASEDVDKDVLARRDTFSCLRTLDVTRARLGE